MGETRVEKWYREGKVEEEEEEEGTRGLGRGDDFLERKSRLELDNCPIHGFLNFVLFSFVALGKRDVARDSRNFSLLLEQGEGERKIQSIYNREIFLCRIY